MRAFTSSLVRHYVLAFNPRMLVHHNRIRAARHRSARHDLHARARLDHTSERHARAALANQPQFHSRLRGIRSPQRKSIARRAIEGRIIPVRANVFRHDAPEGTRRVFREFNGFSGRRRRTMPRANHFNHFRASRFVGKHGALEPGREFRPSRNNRRIAFRPGGYHPDFNLQLV